MNGHVPIATRMARALPQLRILWGALFGSTVMVFVVSRVAVFGAPPTPAPAMMGPTLFAFACLIGLFGVYFPRSQLVAALKRRAPTPPIVITPAIVGFALTEAMALMGLMLTVMHVPGGYALPLFCISGLVFLARFPTLTRPLGLLGPRLDLSDSGPEIESDALR